jgi:6-phosphogluconate dehydrogenase
MEGSIYEMAMVGLGVMGRNLALNMADKGFAVTGYDVDPQKVVALNLEAKALPARGVDSVGELAAAMRPPRAIMMMVPAGPPVDAVIDALLPLMAPHDLLIDGGNSHFRETEARARRLESKQLLYMGVGISGGERGARLGPSIMPGGPEAAYARVRPVFEAIAAKVDSEPCVAYLGPGSAGDYVKMVHNGIEYALMQVIAESYDLMKRGLGLGNDELGQVYLNWSTSMLKGYLMEITARIFAKKDRNSGQFLLDVILDEAQGKGTGKWTAQDAMDLRVPVPAINEAVAMRDLSDLRQERREAHNVLGGPSSLLGEDRQKCIDRLGRALQVSTLIIFGQAMAQLRVASHDYGYGLNLAEVARIWRGGCIIRSDMLEPIRQAFLKKPDLKNLLLDPVFSKVVTDNQADLRRVVCLSAEHGMPVPGLGSCLAYLDSYRSAWLPANLVQAQRDYFGSHMYRRVDKDGLFHTEWEE